MNVLKNSAKILSLCLMLGFAVDAKAQYYGEREQWQQVDEVHFYSGKTAIAIQNCKNARLSDRRCNDRSYECSLCSEIAHSDHSSYVVYQLANGGWQPGRPGPGRPDRPGRPGRPGYPGQPPGYGAPERHFVQTFHFYDNKTAVAKNKCEVQRSRMAECRSANYECTPCTIESHTDHSQFDLYRIIHR